MSAEISTRYEEGWIEHELFFFLSHIPQLIAYSKVLLLGHCFKHSLVLMFRPREVIFWASTPPCSEKKKKKRKNNSKFCLQICLEKFRQKKKAAINCILDYICALYPLECGEKVWHHSFGKVKYCEECILSSKIKAALVIYAS